MIVELKWVSSFGTRCQSVLCRLQKLVDQQFDHFFQNGFHFAPISAIHIKLIENLIFGEEKKIEKCKIWETFKSIFWRGREKKNWQQCAN